jgi:predicted DNA-binding transcriptional regulator YafY
VNRIERMTAILLVLQDRAHPKRTSEEIAALFEVSRRTVLRDIQALCEMGVPVIAQEGSGGGYSLPPDYTLPPLALTTNEALLMLLSLSALNKLADLPFAPERASLSAKLRSLLTDRQNTEVEKWMGALSMEIPEREYETPFLEQLLTCAKEGQWVQASYQSSRRVSTGLLLPKRLTSSNGFWYCEAYALEHLEERKYRADRFLSVEPAEAPPLPAPLAAPLPYAHESHPEVRILLTPTGVSKVKQEPHLGHSIRVEQDGSGVCLFRCPPSELDWLARYLLDLGINAKVLAPEELKSKLVEFAKSILAQYQGK